MGYIITPDLFSHKMKILIYGDPGSGKTFLSGTAQDHELLKNVHVFNIDGGMMTLADRGDISATDIHVVDELEQELYKISAHDKKYDGVKTVVIDNITELQTLNLEAIVQSGLDASQKRRKDFTIDDIFQEDYGKSTKQLARILRGFRDLPIHVIYIAHRKDKKRQNSSVIEESKPALTQMLGTAVMGYMDFVWYLYTMEVPTESDDGRLINVTHRFLLTQPYNGYTCKTRGLKFQNALGLTVQDPNLAQIMDVYLDSNGIKNTNIKGGK